MFDLFGRERRSLAAALEEEKRFKGRFKRRLAAFEVMRDAILNEHLPSPFPAPDGVRLELRCVRCHTDEHHTRHSDNYLLWPCPTVAPILATAEQPTDLWRSEPEKRLVNIGVDAWVDPAPPRSVWRSDGVTPVNVNAGTYTQTFTTETTVDEVAARLAENNTDGSADVTH